MYEITRFFGSFHIMRLPALQNVPALRPDKLSEVTAGAEPSLSGAPLARIDRGEPVAGLQRLLDLAGRALEPIYGFRSLLAFKAKFQPDYRPLYLAYPDPAALPAIGNAIGRAYLPHLSPREATRLVRRLTESRRNG